MESLSEQVRRAMKTSDYYRQEISRLAGVDPAVLCRFAAGRSMSLASLDAVGLVLGLRIEEPPKAGNTRPDKRRRKG